MAKRRRGSGKRGGRPNGRNRGPAAGVGRHLKLDDLLVVPAADAPAAAAVAPATAPTPAAAAPAPAPALSVVPAVDAVPHVTLGALWGVVTFVAAVAAAPVLAIWLAAAAALAGAQAARSWRKQPAGPTVAVAAAGAGVLPLAAAAGPAFLVGAALAVALVSLLWRPESRRAAPVPSLVCALGPGLAAAGPVLLRTQGTAQAIVLLSYIAVYDASAFLVGSGATREWEGPAAGVAFIFAVTLAVAAILVPPFSGAKPWVLGLLAAGLAPVGPVVATRMIGDPKTRVPALRRLDSLLVAGPVWTLAALLLLR